VGIFNERIFITNYIMRKIHLFFASFFFLMNTLNASILKDIVTDDKGVTLPFANILGNKKNNID